MKGRTPSLGEDLVIRKVFEKIVSDLKKKKKKKN